MILFDMSQLFKKLYHIPIFYVYEILKCTRLKTENVVIYCETLAEFQRSKSETAESAGLPL